MKETYAVVIIAFLLSTTTGSRAKTPPKMEDITDYKGEGDIYRMVLKPGPDGKDHVVSESVEHGEYYDDKFGNKWWEGCETDRWELANSEQEIFRFNVRDKYCSLNVNSFSKKGLNYKNGLDARSFVLL